LFYDLIGAAKIPAEYKECVLNQPDRFSVCYTASDTHAGLKVWEHGQPLFKPNNWFITLVKFLNGLRHIYTQQPFSWIKLSMTDIFISFSVQESFE